MVPTSGPIERGFLSGPIERGFLSGPLDRGGLFSGPMEKTNSSSDQFQRSYSHGSFSARPRSSKGSLIRALQRVLSKTISRGQSSIVAPMVKSVKEQDWIVGSDKQNELTISSDVSLDDEDSLEGGQNNLQWAQGKAGEDRVHVVVSEEHGWVFVGIYDGFNGPDAPDYLLSNLYSAVHKEVKGLLWDDKGESSSNSTSSVPSENPNSDSCRDAKDVCSRCVEQENYPCGSGDANCESMRKKGGKNSRSKYKGAAKKWEENQRMWRCKWDRERLELDQRLKEHMNRNGSGAIDHSDVLSALSQALRKTEEAYLDIADKILVENPELALMGSCVLVMLMKGEDVYVMSVGDSRAVLGKKAEPDLWRQDLERIKEETFHDLEFDGDRSNVTPSLTAFQLTVDHSTSIDEVRYYTCALLLIDLCWGFFLLDYG